MLLRERGHDVRVLSRSPGASTHRGDLSTGEGVACAAADAELILHAASDSRRAGRRDLLQTLRLLEACADVRHLLYVSIVGIDAIPFRYYQRKLACEQAIQSSDIGHTILRATQFHELLARALQGTERLPVAPLPLRWRFQSVAASEVGARAVELLEGEPLGRAPDLGGPQVLSVREIVEAWREHRRRPRAIASVRWPGRIYRAFAEGHNTCPDHACGRRTWGQFVTGFPMR